MPNAVLFTNPVAVGITSVTEQMERLSILVYGESSSR